jgi:putative membrane protein
MSAQIELVRTGLQNDRSTRQYRVAMAIFLVIVAATWWRPPHPAEQAMHHSLTLVGLVALILVQRARPLPYGSFLLILIFLTLHSIAARWIYSFVPYDEWTSALFGVRLSDVFGWQRNNFDRLVHFSYGICFGAVIFRALREWRGWPSLRAGIAAVDIVLSTSALYELFEWGVAMTLAPGEAEAYNGQQGDMWDAQKDMAIATSGAVLGVLVAASVLRLRRGPSHGGV